MNRKRNAWKNKTPEEREKWIENLRKAINNRSKRQKEMIARKRSLTNKKNKETLEGRAKLEYRQYGYRVYFNNLSEEEKKRRNKANSDRMKKMWAEMDPKKKEERLNKSFKKASKFIKKNVPREKNYCGVIRE